MNPHLTGTPVLETARLTLRAMGPQDVDAPLPDLPDLPDWDDTLVFRHPRPEDL